MVSWTMAPYIWRDDDKMRQYSGKQYIADGGKSHETIMTMGDEPS